MHIPDDPGYYEKFYFTPGDIGFQPIDTSVGRLGVLVCWDQWYPEAARLMAHGRSRYAHLSHRHRLGPRRPAEEKERQLQAWVTIQRAHAVANGIPVVSVNRVGFEADPAAGPGAAILGQQLRRRVPGRTPRPGGRKIRGGACGRRSTGNAAKPSAASGLSCATGASTPTAIC